MVKKRIPQYLGGPPRPKSHSGKGKTKREMKSDSENPSTPAAVKVKRELPGELTVRTKSEATHDDTGTQCHPPSASTESKGTQCNNPTSIQGTQCDNPTSENKGTQCGIPVNEELERLEIENARLHAEKSTLVRTCMKLQDDLVWARGLRRDGLDAQSIRDILLERRSSTNEE